MGNAWLLNVWETAYPSNRVNTETTDCVMTFVLGVRHVAPQWTSQASTAVRVAMGWGWMTRQCDMAPPSIPTY